MLLEKRTYPDGTLMGSWKLTETQQELEELLTQKAYIEEVNSFSNEKRRTEWLAARVLIKILCNNEKLVQYTNSGKPFLEDKSYNISISHTKGFVSVIAHPNKQVAIDIECINNKVERVKHKFLSEKELSHISAQPPMLSTLLLYWCAKEALFKIIDDEAIDFSQQLHILPFDAKQQGIIHAFETRTEAQQSYLLNYEINTDFALVWTAGN